MSCYTTWYDSTALNRVPRCIDVHEDFIAFSIALPHSDDGVPISGEKGNEDRSLAGIFHLTDQVPDTLPEPPVIRK